MTTVAFYTIRGGAIVFVRHFISESGARGFVASLTPSQRKGVRVEIITD